MRRPAGFSLIELMIVVLILGILVALGVPSLMQMMRSAQVKSMAEFYADGLRTARQGAIRRNASTRFTLVPTAGRMDWQIDWCWGTATTPCNDGGNAPWSTPTAASAADPLGATNGDRSITRSALSQSLTTTSITVLPAGATSVHFRSNGWVDTVNGPTWISQIRVDPVDATSTAPTAASLSLSGIVSRCDPTIAAGDSRACP